MEKKENPQAQNGNKEDEESLFKSMFLEPFPGDQVKDMEPNWKPAIYWAPPFVVAGFSWAVGLRNPYHLLLMTLICSILISALLYYLFFAESDFLIGFFRSLKRR